MKTINKSFLFVIFVTLFTNIAISQKRGRGVYDFEGNYYHSIKVGETEWMTENLKTKFFSNGEAIQSDSNSRVVFEPLKNSNTEGNYYTWNVITDSRNVCPTGWRVPSIADWDALTSKFGGQDVAAIDLKSSYTEYWNNPIFEATNYSGFSAIPEGFVNENGSYSNIGKYGYWWSTTEKDSDVAWGMEIGHNQNQSYKGFANKKDGLSVRCISRATK